MKFNKSNDVKTERYFYDAGDARLSTKISQTWVDFRDGVLLYKIWLHLALRDVVATTARTYLGPIWLVFSALLQITVLGFFYSKLLGQPIEVMLPYVSAGLVIWGFISSLFFSSYGTITKHKAIIIASHLPFSMVFYREVTGLFLTTIIKMSAFVLYAFVFDVQFNSNFFLIIPSIFLYFVMAMSFKVIFGVLGSRFRDIQPITQPLGFIFFIITPVLWEKKLIKGDNSWIADVNPFTHILSIMRDPLLGKMPSIFAFSFVTGLAMVATLIALLLYSKTRSKIPLWL